MYKPRWFFWGYAVLIALSVAVVAFTGVFLLKINGYELQVYGTAVDSRPGLAILAVIFAVIWTGAVTLTMQALTKRFVSNWVAKQYTRKMSQEKIHNLIKEYWNLPSGMRLEEDLQNEIINEYRRQVQINDFSLLEFAVVYVILLLLSILFAYSPLVTRLF